MELFKISITALIEAIEGVYGMKVFGLREQQPRVIHEIVGGALFDFAGYLTSLPEDQAIMCGAAHEVPPLVEALKRWAETKGLDLASADVRGWQEYLGEEGQ